MSFKIERNDITKVSADAIVNTANPMPTVGAGTDTAIYKAAGYEELIEERRKIGVIPRGESRATPSFKLEKNGVKFIIHTIGVFWQGGSKGETDILRSCYKTSLKTAVDLGCKSIAIPFLATGSYCFPKELALQIAVEEISKFLLENEIDVKLIVYDRKSFKISEKLFSDVEDYLQKNLTDEDESDFFSDALKSCKIDSSEDFEEERERIGRKKQAQRIKKRESSPIIGAALTSAEIPVIHNLESACEATIAPVDVDAFIQKGQTKNFQDTLQSLIAERNLPNADIWKKADMDRKFFSKIISTKDYVPKKKPVMALGLALELPLEDFERFLAAAGYAFMPSDRFDLIIKYCVMNKIYNIVKVDMILDDHGQECFGKY